MTDPVPRGMCVHWALLNEWWCFEPDVSEEEALKLVMEKRKLPVTDPALVRDRLFGYWPCSDERMVPGRRHVLFASGHYTFTNPHLNKPLSEDSRRELWADLVKENGEPGHGLFSEPWVG